MEIQFFFPILELKIQNVAYHDYIVSTETNERQTIYQPREDIAKSRRKPSY